MAVCKTFLQGFWILVQIGMCNGAAIPSPDVGKIRNCGEYDFRPLEFDMG